MVNHNFELSFTSIMATGAIQYGQYRVPTVDEMVNFGVGQVSIDINCQGMIPYKYIDDLSKNLVSLRTILFQFIESCTDIR